MVKKARELRNDFFFFLCCFVIRSGFGTQYLVFLFGFGIWYLVPNLHGCTTTHSSKTHVDVAHVPTVYTCNVHGCSLQLAFRSGIFTWINALSLLQPRGCCLSQLLCRGDDLWIQWCFLFLWKPFFFSLSFARPSIIHSHAMIPSHAEFSYLVSGLTPFGRFSYRSHVSTLVLRPLIGRVYYLVNPAHNLWYER